MTVSELSTLITRYTGANTTDYPNTQRATDMTNAFNYVVSKIIEAQGESDYDDAAWGDYAEGDFALTTNRDYALDPDENIQFIKKLSVTYDGTTYYEATPIDSGEIEIPSAPSGSSMETTIDSYFSKTAPRYDFKQGSIFLYPRASSADVAAGASAHMEWGRGPSPITSSDLTTGTRVPRIDTTFQPLIAIIPSIYWNIGKGKDIKGLLLQKQELEDLLNKQYSLKVRARRLQLVSSAETDDYS